MCRGYKILLTLFGASSPVYHPCIQVGVQFMKGLSFFPGSDILKSDIIFVLFISDNQPVETVHRKS